ncbi:hypothetical protein [Embleya sp. NPDC050493]|uniref:hypothetical protein n=1 Tax=Embleya sp. NPDC050493 TaxID=3363989 RepID=UPI00378C0605
MDVTSADRLRRSDEWLNEAAKSALPVWEAERDHDAFRRFLRAQGWSAVQAIAVIRRVQGCSLRDAIDVHESYRTRARAEEGSSEAGP